MCLLKMGHKFSSMLLVSISKREARAVAKTLRAHCPDVSFPPQTHCGHWSSQSGSSLKLALGGAS